MWKRTAALSATGWTSSTSKVIVSQPSKDRSMKSRIGIPADVAEAVG